MNNSALSKRALERIRRFHEHVTAASDTCSFCNRLALEFDSIRRERDEVADKLKRELEKAEGQLDIILRECQGDDDASLANDYGGTGWENVSADGDISRHFVRTIGGEREMNRVTADQVREAAKTSGIQLTGADVYALADNLTVILVRQAAYRGAKNDEWETETEAEKR